MKPHFHIAQVALGVALMLMSSLVSGQTANASGAVVSPLTVEEVKAKYQNCPRGNYAGPRPGKTRYTKDPWIWAVTSEFVSLDKDPSTWQYEVALAGQLYATAQTDSASSNSKPVTLDLDAGGITRAARAQGQRVLFDIDDVGFMRESDRLGLRGETANIRRWRTAA